MVSLKAWNGQQPHALEGRFSGKGRGAGVLGRQRWRLSFAFLLFDLRELSRMENMDTCALQVREQAPKGERGQDLRSCWGTL